MSDRVFFFDTTLRDGEQSPGASMNMEEKLEMAHQLEALGVDILEAGFPYASQDEFESVQGIASALRDLSVAGLTRAIERDIDVTWDSLRNGSDPTIHVFMATSDIHIEHKLRTTREGVLDQVKRCVRHARQKCGRVEFSAEDASRSDLDFLCRVVEVAVKEGATVVNLPDTVGYALPDVIHHMFATIIEKVPGADKVVLSTHNHNDLGLAVANSLAAVQAGARQVECTINGIGERAGNAALEEIVMAIRTRPDLLPYETGIDTTQIDKSSKLLSSLTGLLVPNNKPIVGRNAFAHEAGVHQDGMIKERTTYEIMTPQSVGRPTSELVLGKHSGRHGLKKRLEDLGYKLESEELDKVYQEFIKLADKKKEVFDNDLAALMDEEHRHEVIPERYQLDYLQVTSGTNIIPSATLRLKTGEETVTVHTTGDGPIDATFRGIEDITGISGRLLDYQTRAVTRGMDAVGEAFVKIDFGDRVIVGQGFSTDVTEASAKAYLAALNKHLAMGVRNPSAESKEVKN